MSKPPIVGGSKMPPPIGPGKNKSGTGLKILWIPGRKKHHDKGIYKPTNHNVEHKHGDRKNEVWNLGGSKAHDDILIGSDKDDKLDLINPTTPSVSVLPSASLGVASVNIDDCSDSDADTEIKLQKCIIKEYVLKKYNVRDSLQSLTSAKDQISTHSGGDGDEKRSAGRHFTKSNLDSIERLDLDDLDGQPKLHHNGFKSNSKCDKKQKREDKAVKCLYYTMMCCECTIS